MIHNRLQGFVGLHSIVLCALLGLSFILSLLAFTIFPWVTLNPSANFELYGLGILFASFSIRRHLHGTVQRYGRLGTEENLKITAQQLMRLMLVLFTVAFVTKDTGVSRIFLLTYIVIAGAVIFLTNQFLPRILAAVFLRNSLQRTAIIATEGEVEYLRHWLARYTDMGVQLVGYIAPRPFPQLEELPWLGPPSEILDLIERRSIDQLFIDYSNDDRVQGRRLSAVCERVGCRVRTFVNIQSLLPSPHATFESDGRYAFATVTPEPLDNPMNQLAKRMLDIAIALPVVIFVIPVVLVVTAIFQRIQSPGSILYYQSRTGINGSRFIIFKIRTMHPSDRSQEAQQARQGDARVYPFGRFLRRTSLDELPQFINVLRGDMSVTGPRPHLIEHDELFAQFVSSYRKRHFVKPGITGLAQSKGCRGEVGRPSAIMRRVRYDMYYIAKWSLSLELRIIANTIRQIFFPPKSAY